MDLNALISEIIPSLSSLSDDNKTIVSAAVLIVLISIFSGTLRQLLMKGD